MALTCFATLAVRETLRQEGVAAVIKWPNDIYVGRKKICGMLVESGLEGASIAWSVIGIGINLNQTVFPGGVLNPTSLKRLTGKTYEPAHFLETLCRKMESRLSALETPEGRNALRDAYERDLFQKDSPARYRDLATGEEFMGTIRGITPEGLLRMEKHHARRPSAHGESRRPGTDLRIQGSRVYPLIIPPAGRRPRRRDPPPGRRRCRRRGCPRQLSPGVRRSSA